MFHNSLNSSSILSSESDIQYDRQEIFNEKPFVTAYDLSSDEVVNCGIEEDPFNENISNYNKQKERSWLVNKDVNCKKTISLPLYTRKHIIDFFKDFNNGEKLSLPTLGIGRSDSIQRISADTLNDVLNNKYNIDYKIIDCRYDYEYEGGHIKNAINISSLPKARILFKKPAVLIFHCEYSSVRAPKLAHYVRNIDRRINTYPKLTLPEIYILEGGYKEFYINYPEMCEPRGYVSMKDVIFKYKR